MIQLRERPDMCPRCNGMGYTPDTAAVLTQKRVGRHKVFTTKCLGSGCVKCHGTGLIGAKA